MWVTVVTSVALVLVAALYLYLKKRYSFFDEYGIRSLGAFPFIGSHWRSFILNNKNIMDDFIAAYRAFPDEKYVGVYEGMNPVILIRDPEIIKRITVKDFDHFVDHRNLLVELFPEELLAKAMIFLKGQKWRDMRGALSPAFTGSKMRMMLPLMAEISEQVVHYLNGKSKDCDKGKLTEPMEMNELFARFANDVIASCAFGLKVDSLNDKENKFYTMGKLVTTFKKIQILLVFLVPGLCKLLGINIFDEEGINFFRNLVSESMKHREENQIVRHDMIQLLMEAKKGTLRHTPQKSNDDLGYATVQETQQISTKRHWTDDELAAQAFVFFFAGFDTTSTALTFAAHELTINPEVQEKLRAEVDRCHAENSQLTYEVIQGLKYMDMVISESLRKWASAVIVDRECAKQFTLEPTRPGAKPFTMKPKSYLHIYVNAIHLDEKYFPEPERFEPERFSDERKHTIQPFTYMPFGSGPRNCIGSRFALMEVKVILYQLMLNFELVACEKTTNPIRLAPGHKLVAQNGSWVQFKPRK